MIDWSAIDTVLLDMDGTLLDLHFDNHFWQHHLPLRFAERHGLDPRRAPRPSMSGSPANNTGCAGTAPTIGPPSWAST